MKPLYVCDCCGLSHSEKWSGDFCPNEGCRRSSKIKTAFFADDLQGEIEKQLHEIKGQYDPVKYVHDFPTWLVYDCHKIMEVRISVLEDVLETILQAVEK